MKILLVETLLTGFRKRWAEELKQFSRHEIEIANTTTNPLSKPDLILATDSVDLTTYLNETQSWSAGVPTAIYFHQYNSPAINQRSAIAANHVFFTSQYHLDSFIKSVAANSAANIRNKSSVLPVAINLQKFNTYKPAKIEKPPRAVILWNHAWHADKKPDLFFNALFTLAEHGIDFRLIVLGKQHDDSSAIFEIAKEKLADKILHWGYAESFEEYCKWLWTADMLPVTSMQDFTGNSVIEAMYCNVVPLLPKRLAYPEYIPEVYRHTFFYDEEDYLVKLQKRIMDVKYLRVMNMQQYAKDYDWESLIGRYDEALKQLITL